MGIVLKNEFDKTEKINIEQYLQYFVNRKYIKDIIKDTENRNLSYQLFDIDEDSNFVLFKINNQNINKLILSPSINEIPNNIVDGEEIITGIF